MINSSPKGELNGGRMFRFQCNPWLRVWRSRAWLPPSGLTALKYMFPSWTSDAIMSLTPDYDIRLMSGLQSINRTLARRYSIAIPGIGPWSSRTLSAPSLSLRVLLPLVVFQQKDGAGGNVLQSTAQVNHANEHEPKVYDPSRPI